MLLKNTVHGYQRYCILILIWFVKIPLFVHATQFTISFCACKDKIIQTNKEERCYFCCDTSLVMLHALIRHDFHWGRVTPGTLHAYISFRKLCSILQWILHNTQTSLQFGWSHFWRNTNSTGWVSSRLLWTEIFTEDNILWFLISMCCIWKLCGRSLIDHNNVMWYVFKLQKLQVMYSRPLTFNIFINVCTLLG